MGQIMTVQPKQDAIKGSLGAIGSIVGTAVGTYYGGPAGGALGGQIGGTLGGKASQPGQAPSPIATEDRMTSSQMSSPVTGGASNSPSAIDRRMQQLDHQDVLKQGLDQLEYYPELKKTYGPVLQNAYQQTQIG